MAEHRVKRRLAAILAADVVGYARLMGADEAGTLAVLNAHRAELIEPKVAEYGGRIVKTMGDGFLMEFPSAVDAVQHAVDVQRAMARRNRNVSPGRRIEFRIGINVGDVIVEGDDIFGDGVNVAARLEGLAEPGGIDISGTVFESVRNRLDVDFDDLGEQSVKNIAEPVRVFRVALDTAESATGAPAQMDAMFHKPAVAVLPFDNLSGDADQEYFADGLTEDIITALSLWRSFPVIARNSTFAYKGTAPDIRKVGEELGARYVIEGSVRRSGNRVRVTAQLIDAETGHHVWAERFDRDLEDIFALQDELTQRIAATVAPEMERTEHKRAVDTKPRNLDALDYVHRGMKQLYEFSEDGNANAREMFGKAIERDPGNSSAYTGIGWSHIRDMQFGSAGSRERTVADALAAARRAVELDRTDSYAHMVLGVALQWSRDHDFSISEFETAIELNPNNANAYGSIGHELVLVGRPEEGIQNLEKGIRLNPQDPRNHAFFAFMARAHLHAGRYDEAVEWARKAIRWRPDAPIPHLMLATILGHLDRLEEARADLAECERIRPGYTADAENWHPYKHAEDTEHFLDGLRKAGWTG